MIRGASGTFHRKSRPGLDCPQSSNSVQPANAPRLFNNVSHPWRMRQATYAAHLVWHTAAQGCRIGLTLSSHSASSPHNYTVVYCLTSRLHAGRVATEAPLPNGWSTAQYARCLCRAAATQTLIGTQRDSSRKFLAPSPPARRFLLSWFQCWDEPTCRRRRSARSRYATTVYGDILADGSWFGQGNFKSVESPCFAS
jgi:hypothetical protein